MKHKVLGLVNCGVEIDILQVYELLRRCHYTHFRGSIML